MVTLLTDHVGTLQSVTPKTRMTIEETIQKAYEGGLDKSEYSNLPALLLKPVFWKAFGKGMGWEAAQNKRIDEGERATGYHIIEPPDWKTKWHYFIDCLANGKDIEEFFNQF